MRDKCKQIKDVPITDLQLDLDNFRIGQAENQQECIALMLHDKKSREQMARLARHIAVNGLSPRPIIVIEGKEPGKYIVKDGNRRVTALKLLNNPAEAPENDRIIFSGIAEKHNIPNHVDCELTDPNTALEIMELEHLGAQDGVGQITWGSEEKDNLKELKGEKPQNDIARAVLAHMKTHGIESTEDKVKITIFQRLFQDREVQKSIGIDWNGQNLKILMDEDDVLHILEEILKDFTERKGTTKKIFHAEDRKTYIDGLFTAMGIQGPKPRTFQKDKEKTASRPSESSQPAAASTRESIQPPEQEKSENCRPGIKSGRTKPLWDRKRLIEKKRFTVNFPRDAARAAGIAYELTRTIDVKDSPNAAAVLMRLLLELSVSRYFKQHNLGKPDPKLAARAQAVSQDMQMKGYISKNLKETLDKIGQTNQIISTHTLNQWVHNESFTPTPQTLCTFWDDIAPFVELCWKK